MPTFMLMFAAWTRRAWQRSVEMLFSMDRRMALFACSIPFVIIAFLDYVTPPRLNLAFTYVLVILLATWNLGALAGAAYAVLASAMQLWALIGNPTYPPFSFYWNVDLANRMFTFFIVVALTSPLHRLYDRERRQARVDGLTGAANRTQFVELVALEIARSRRSGEAFTLAYLDCDDFKAINDVRGHEEGDTLLRSLVTSVRRQLRITDVVARLGGDEFAILFPQTDGPKALQALERIRGDVARTFSARDWQSSLSIGAATFRKPAHEAEELIAACDTLMYRAKTGGKGRIVYESVA